MFQMVGNTTASYLAEFAFLDTQELAAELLIQAPSELRAKQFAEKYAVNLGLNLFRLTPATVQQFRLYRLMGKAVCLDAM